MQISNLLQEDQRVQEIVKNLSCTLKEDECLFAFNEFGTLGFQKIKVKDKAKFRAENWPFSPVYITSFPLTNKESIKITGILIEKMQRESETIYNNN